MAAAVSADPNTALRGAHARGTRVDHTELPSPVLAVVSLLAFSLGAGAPPVCAVPTQASGHRNGRACLSGDAEGPRARPERAADPGGCPGLALARSMPSSRIPPARIKRPPARGMYRQPKTQTTLPGPAPPGPGTRARRQQWRCGARAGAGDGGRRDFGQPRGPSSPRLPAGRFGRTVTNRKIALVHSGFATPAALDLGSALRA
jgi:hypothetical protein